MFEINGMCDGVEVEVNDRGRIDGHVEGSWGYIEASFPYALVPDDGVPENDPTAWCSTAGVRVDDDRILVWIEPKEGDPFLLQAEWTDGGEVVAEIIEGEVE
jgi:hypothetical protein